MFRSHHQVTSKLSGVCIAIIYSNQCLTFSHSDSKEVKDKKILDLAIRLKHYFPVTKENKNVLLLRESNKNMKVYSLLSSKGLPTARVATTEIRGSVEKISNVWLDQDKRSKWDRR